jgi:hypothetical protein
VVEKAESTSSVMNEVIKITILLQSLAEVKLCSFGVFFKEHIFL